MLRKITITSLLLVLPTLQQNEQFLNPPLPPNSCQLQTELGQYDFRVLTNKQRDYHVKDTQSGQNFTFNFCQASHNPCNQSVNASFAYRSSLGVTGAKECSALTDKVSLATIHTGIYTISYDNGTVYEQSVVAYTLYGGDLCDGEPSSLSYMILCDAQGDINQIPDEKIIRVNGTNKCHPTISFAHKAGCNSIATISSGWDHDPIEEIRRLFGYNYQVYMLQQVVCIILGMYLLFKGFDRKEEIIGLCFGYGVFILTLAYFMNTTTLGNVSYILSIVLGLLIGHYAYHNLSHIFVAFLSGLVGFILALLIISIFQIYNDLFVYLFIIGGIFLGITQHFISTKIIFYMCVLIGAYLIVEGITTFLGGVPSFLIGIQDLIHGTGNYRQYTIIYIVIYVCLAFYGYTYQKRHKAY